MNDLGLIINLKSREVKHEILDFLKKLESEDKIKIFYITIANNSQKLTIQKNIREDLITNPYYEVEI